MPELPVLVLLVSSSLQSSLGLTARVAALRACRLFEGVGSEDAERIAAFVRLMKFAKGDYLFREGEPTNGFFIVRAGAVNIHRSGADGRERTIHVFREGESFAEATMADGGAYPADARAEEPTLALFVPRAEFLDLLRQRPELSIRMLASMSRHLHVLVDALDDMSRKDAETRLAHWLLSRCPGPRAAKPVAFRLDVTKTVLAGELRVRKETLSRALAKMRELGLVESSGRTICIPNPARLDGMLRDNLGRLDD